MANKTIQAYKLTSKNKYTAIANSSGLVKPLQVAGANFTDGNLIPATTRTGYDWSNGAQSGSTTTIVGGAYKVTYPIPSGDQYNWLQNNMPNGNKQVFIEFDSKMPAAKNGLKFVKVFGRNITGGANEVANATFGLQYTAVTDGIGSFTAINFGDGSTNSNDATQIVTLDGSNPSAIGRSYGAGAVVSNPMGRNFRASDWGTGYHHFKLMVKFNSGTTALNEVPDGEFYVEIDGSIFLVATGLFNRHWSNGDISHIQFGGWSQGSGPAFEIHYDNIRVSKYGFLP